MNFKDLEGHKAIACISTTKAEVHKEKLLTVIISIHNILVINYGFIFNLQDEGPPIFTWTPYDVTYLTQPGVLPVPVYWIEPVAKDNSGSVILESNYQPMDNFSLGTTVVNYSARDPNGLTVNFTFTVSVYGMSNAC